jgi:hypothetical protein
LTTDHAFLLFKTNGPYVCDESVTAGLDCAVLFVTPILIEQIQARCELLAQVKRVDAAANELYFWDDVRPDFYDYDLVSDLEEEEDFDSRSFQEYGYAPVLTRMLPLLGTKYQTQRVECGQMAIFGWSSISVKDAWDFQVKWTAIPKHTSIYVETEAIGLDALKRLLNG